MDAKERQELLDLIMAKDEIIAELQNKQRRQISSMIEVCKFLGIASSLNVLDGAGHQDEIQELIGRALDELVKHTGGMP